MMRLMSVNPTSEPSGDAPSVAAVVVAEDAELLGPCLDSVGAQVYGLHRVFVVGGDDDVRRVAGLHDALWRPNLDAVRSAIGEETYIWILDQRSRPLPDALRALVDDGGRVEASVAGSKILDADDPDMLLSVGYATDVFGAPYTGLQSGEVDQEQYDVIRDVAAVSSASMLIRRDLFFGLGGVDRALGAASGSVDFCQRARLRGGRVAVIPSSEVRYQGPDPSPGWREQAGELRSMLKAYSPVTLLWAVPVAFVVGLLEAVVSPFLGRWTLFGFLASWLWNLAVLPSTIVARFRTRRGRAVGDEELFRYQVNGSARLRMLSDEAMERIRARFPEGVLAGFSDAVETGQETIRRPAFLAGFGTLLVAAFATRDIWTNRLPVSGFSLPPPDSGTAALAAYAGGWNPAGFGSPEVLRPDVAVVALVQTVMFGRGGLAVAVVTVAAFIAGAFGTARLLRVWGVGAVPGYLAGITLVAGPAVFALGEASHWPALVAVGVLPWPILLSLRPWPETWLRRFGRMASIVLTTGLVAAFAPAAAPLPAAAVILWALVGTGARWVAAVRAVAGLALAIPLLMPWILYADLPGLYLDGAAAFWEPPVVALAAAGVALIGTLAGGDRPMAAVAGWGGLLAAAGGFLARAGDFGLGREARVGGLVAVALGIAVLAGAAVESYGRRESVFGLQRAAAVVAAIAGVGLALGAVFVVAPGRNGLPPDAFSDRFSFAAGEERAPARVLVFGPEDALPGTSRDLQGLAYRVFVPPAPQNWEAYLNEPRLGDDALTAFLDEFVAGDVRRAGSRLAAFGIGWVAFLEESPLEGLFETQLDMVPVRSFDIPVFRNEVPAAVALGADGAVWDPDGTGYVRPASAQSVAVGLAVNADDRWGPGTWIQADWGMRVIARAGSVGFAGYEPRRTMALGSLGWLGVLLLTTAFGWWRGRR
jgi:hypothetical protein